MRITKKMLRESVNAMHHRITEVCAIYAAGKIRDELQRIHPIHITEPTPEREEECLRQVLADALDRVVPPHWYQ